MKQETKELIDWIKKQINIAKTNNIDPAWNGKHEAYNDDYNRAMAFLDSLPEIEDRLTRGGYVEDKDGTPCCDGDSVILHLLCGNREGQLRWDHLQGQFAIWINEQGADRSFPFTKDIFEKVKTNNQIGES